MRKYVDISHFRAPFKNWPGIGADTGTGAPAGDLVSAQIDTEDNGVRVFKPALADLILQGLAAFSVIFLDNETVKLDLRFMNDPRESGTAWAQRQLADGKSVIAQAASGAHLFATPMIMDRFLRAASTTGQEQEWTAGVTPMGAVLARPTSRAALMGGSLGVALVAVGAVGLGVYLFGKSRLVERRAALGRRSLARPNRRRTHRRHRRSR